MTAEIGHNAPPEPIGAFDAMARHIDDLVDLAASCLTGEPIITKPQADAVDELLADIKKAYKDADTARDAEKRPHLEAGREVDALWKPLLNKADIAKKTAQDALTPYRLAQQAIRDAEAQAKRDEAARLEQEALAAFQASAVTDLDARIAADALLEEANKSKAAANRVDKQATGLRTSWTGHITDYGAAISWLKAHRAADLKSAIDELVRREVNAGQRIITGVLIEQVRKAA